MSKLGSVKLGSIKYLVPAPARSWLRRRGLAQKGRLLFDRVSDWSVLRRLTPYRPAFGVTHGRCIDRFYIEQFLAAHRNAIAGDVAEFADNRYTLQFAPAPVRSHVLDIDTSNPQVTLALDLTATASAPSDTFDCIIATQVLLVIYDYEASLRTLFKMLRPRGVALITVPGICQVIPEIMLGEGGQDWWRFTSASARRVVAEVFGEANVEVQSFGNVLSAVAFLHGLVQEEITPAELDYHDPAYEVIIGIKATKSVESNLP